MNIHVWKNVAVFACALALWMSLVAIELVSGYSGIYMQAAFGITLFALLVTFWLVNRTTTATLGTPLVQFAGSGVLAFALTGLFIFVAVVLSIRVRHWLADVLPLGD